MIKEKIKNGENLDRAIKRWKRRVDQSGVLKELKDRMEFEKPSVKKRRVKLRAKFRQKQYDKFFNRD